MLYNTQDKLGPFVRSEKYKGGKVLRWVRTASARHAALSLTRAVSVPATVALTD